MLWTESNLNTVPRGAYSTAELPFLCEGLSLQRDISSTAVSAFGTTSATGASATVRLEGINRQMLFGRPVVPSSRRQCSAVRHAAAGANELIWLARRVVRVQERCQRFLIASSL